MIVCALAVLAEERKPLECLDAFGATGSVLFCTLVYLVFFAKRNCVLICWLLTVMESRSWFFLETYILVTEFVKSVDLITLNRSKNLWKPHLIGNPLKSEF